MKRIVLLTAFSIGAFASGAQAEVDLTAASAHDYYSNSTPVAGSVLVGLWLGHPTQKVALHGLSLALPDRPIEAACVSANTRDGEYWLQAAFPVQAGHPEIGHLKFDTKFDDQLAHYDLGDLGIRAELKGNCASGAIGIVVPAFARLDGTLMALVNGQRAVTVSAELLAGDRSVLAPTKCLRIAADRSTAFDHVCSLSLPTPLTTESYRLVVRRLTRAGDEETNAFEIALSYPQPPGAR